MYKKRYLCNTKNEQIYKQNKTSFSIFLKVNKLEEFVTLSSRLFQMIAPLYDKLRFLKSVFVCGMKTLFLLCRKLYLLLENEEMVER